jgi:hypothetical protein
MQEWQQDANALDSRHMTSAQALYTRPMPGGGYVRVELVARSTSDVSMERHCGRIVMERRVKARGASIERPVIVEEVEGEDANRIVAELFRIARDNAAIARRVLRRQRRSSRAD